MNFGEKFKHVRTLRGLSLDELANKCGLSKTYLSEIENSKKRPAMKSLEKIAKALEADAWFFMDDNAVTFSELSKISGYEPPSEILEFISKEDKLPYIVLAKKLDEQGISPEACEIMFNNIIQMMKTINNK